MKANIPCTCGYQLQVDPSLFGSDIQCPGCGDLISVAGSPPAPPVLPARKEKIPFFKSSRRKLLKGELDRLTADGEYSEADHDALLERAASLGLSDEEIDSLRLAAVQDALKGIKERIYESAHVTDHDMQCLQEIGRKYQVTFSDDPLFQMCREIYLMEELRTLPTCSINCADLMVDDDEQVYYAVGTEWAQLRSQIKGYSGISVSIPTGIKGVRFRTGQTKVIRSEELTVLATGTLYITSKRLIFNGDRRNTTVTFSRLLGVKVFRDAVEIEKTSGRSDYFFMEAIRARYVSALVGLLNE